ncbi:MAG: hypothetical protein HY922_05010 [Elusimicrobia bacterium]|nr:hypothetical protein [Elusimicrobiota bacterium]
MLPFLDRRGGAPAFGDRGARRLPGDLLVAAAQTPSRHGARAAPDLPARLRGAEVLRALFVPAVVAGTSVPRDILLVTAADALSRSRRP